MYETHQTASNSVVASYNLLTSLFVSTDLFKKSLNYKFLEFTTQSLHQSFMKTLYGDNNFHKALLSNIKILNC